MAYGISRTGLDWTSKTRTGKTRTSKTRTGKTRTSKTRTGKTRTSATITVQRLYVFLYKHRSHTRLYTCSILRPTKYILFYCFLRKDQFPFSNSFSSFIQQLQLSIGTITFLPKNDS